MTTALIVIDVQQGFGDAEYWGPRNNPDAEANVGRLLAAWRAAGEPVVLVRHDSGQPGSPLRRGDPGNALLPLVDGPAELVFGKRVNSAFHGEVDLAGWLRGRGIERIVLAGIQTNMCVETTARVGGNLGFAVTVALDATFTFDLAGPDGVVLRADELARATAANLDGGGFARVRGTDEVLSIVD